MKHAFLKNEIDYKNRAVMEVYVKTIGKTLKAEEGSNLLDVLLENNIPISYSCMSGRCSTCQCTLVDGEVLKREGIVENNLLSDDGNILACTSILSQENITIEIQEPDEIIQHVAVKRKGSIVNYTKVTDDVRVLRIKTNKTIDYTAGQYVQIQFGNEAVRSYSMATTSNDSELEFHIRIIPDGRVTSKLDTIANNNEKLRISGPLGASYLRLKNDEPIICIAGGTGLAPMASVARGALEADKTKSVELFFGIKYESDIYYIDELNSLSQQYENFKYHIVVECAGENSPYFKGYVTDAVAKMHESLEGFRVYIGGSPAMVNATSDLVKNIGVDPMHVYSDAFYDSSL